MMKQIYIVVQKVYLTNKKKTETYWQEGMCRALFCEDRIEAINKYQKLYPVLRWIELKECEEVSDNFDYFISNNKYFYDHTKWGIIENYNYNIKWLMENMPAEDFKEWWYETR